MTSEEKESIGIDLGTTNSCIAVANGGSVEIVTNAEGERVTPSTILHENNKNIVGRTAARKAVKSPERTVQEPKRKIGTEWAFTTPEGEDYPAEACLGLIAKKLRVDAEEKLDTHLTKAVIAHPAGYSGIQCEATKVAGDLAGFEEVELITEPQAGILSEAFAGRDISGLILVYDCGGGTLDLCLIEQADSEFTTIAKEGDSKLGGSDFTEALVDYLEEEIGPFEQADVKQEVWNRAEDAKKDLSYKEETAITIPTDGGMSSETITRGKFKDLTSHLLDKCEGQLHQLTESADIDWTELDEIVLVGGATKMPQVKEMVASTTGIEPKVSAEPDEAVALGAAVKAAADDGKSLYTRKGGLLPAPELTDVLAHGIGVLVRDFDSGEYVNNILIKKGTQIPEETEAYYSTEEDNQRIVEITLLEGDSEDPDKCEPIGEKGSYVLKGIPAQRKGVPRIKVTLRIDSEGIITLSAKEMESGEEIGVECERPQIIEEEELEETRRRIENSNIE